MKHLLAATALAIVLMLQVALAASGPDTPAPPAAPSAAPSGTTNVVKMPVQNVITLDAGTGRVIQLSAAAASVFAADPKVAEVHPASATSLFVFGVAPGRTTIAALSAGGGPIAQYDVVVKPSRYGAAEAESAIARVLPGATVHVETLQNGLAITGQVKTAADADRVAQIVRGYLPTGQTVDNRLSVAASIQVNLRVRIAEMSRNLVRQLGINWEALGNIGRIGAFPALTVNANKDTAAAIVAATNPLGLGVNFTGLIDALAQDELVHVLAEPNLTAVSGEAASFLVGGEFPIPVAQQNNQVTIEFKQFGVSLAFVPTVASDGQISLKVRPEVSQISNQNAIQLVAGTSLIVVPSLIVRRAETTVRFRDRRTTTGQQQRWRQWRADHGRFADSGRAVPLRQVSAQRDRVGDRRHALCGPAGCQPRDAPPAHRRLPATVRPRADPAAAPERAANRRGEPGATAYPRQRRLHRAMMEMLAC
jgi:pilus assembly protein CpaC